MLCVLVLSLHGCLHIDSVRSARRPRPAASRTDTYACRIDLPQRHSIAVSPADRRTPVMEMKSKVLPRQRMQRDQTRQHCPEAYRHVSALFGSRPGPCWPCVGSTAANQIQTGTGEQGKTGKRGGGGGGRSRSLHPNEVETKGIFFTGSVCKLLL